LLSAQANTMGQKLSISGKNLTFKQIFTSVEQQAGYVVFGNKELFAVKKKISLSVQDMPLADLMAVILKDQPFEYSIAGKTILISNKVVGASAAAPEETASELRAVPVTGHIVDSLGNPVQG